MDKVRLGRALGYGTRHAAKTLAAVAEAAAAPDPRRTGGAGQRSASSPANMQEPAAAPEIARVPRPAQVRSASRSVWAPLATFSSALWLRVTGLFFALVCAVMASGAWRVRGAMRNAAADPVGARHFWLFAACAVLFGYFAVTGFMRASLRERRGAQSAR